MEASLGRGGVQAATRRAVLGGEQSAAGGRGRRGEEKEFEVARLQPKARKKERDEAAIK